MWVVDVARGGRAAIRVRVGCFAETLLCGHLVTPERAEACAVRVGGLRGAVRDVLRNAWCPAAYRSVRRNLSPGPDIVLVA